MTATVGILMAESKRTAPAPETTRGYPGKPGPQENPYGARISADTYEQSAEPKDQPMMNEAASGT